MRSLTPSPAQDHDTKLTQPESNRPLGVKVCNFMLHEKKPRNDKFDSKRSRQQVRVYSYITCPACTAQRKDCAPVMVASLAASRQCGSFSKLACNTASKAARAQGVGRPGVCKRGLQLLLGEHAVSVQRLTPPDMLQQSCQAKLGRAAVNYC